MQSLFLKSLIVAEFAFSAAVATHDAGGTAGVRARSADQRNNIRWETMVGIMQPNDVVGSGKGAVTGGGAPWSTIDGRASVRLDNGRVDFDVTGLVLAGGKGIDTGGTSMPVKGTLVCDIDGSKSGGDSVVVDTPLVDLDDDGNAQFSGNVGRLPEVCSSEDDVAFLIRVGSGRWIASGAVLR